MLQARILLTLLAVVGTWCGIAGEPGPARGDEFKGNILFVPGDVYTGELPAVAASGDADALFEQVKAAVAAGDVPTALRLAYRVVAAEPDHADARRLLGYQRVGDAWAGGYAARQLELGNIWDPQYGWIPAKYAEEFAQGLRPWGRRWITVEEDAERHATLQRGWTVRTDHILVQTNHSRAAAVELAVRLETLHQLWRQLFGEFEVSAAELQARLDGKEPTGYRRRPFHVYYHRNRDEYNAALQRRQPQIAITLGIYFDRERESHFFAGKDQDPGTISHEAVHQFFEEAKPRGRRTAATSNAWAIEGVACYFESLLPVGQPGETPAAYVLGNPAAGRLPAARHRRLVDDFYVPLAELCPLGMSDLQQRSDLPQLYSQSAGLAAFMIDNQDGVYRPAFAELLGLIYAGRDKPDTLTEATGRDFGELDRQYREFLASLPTAAAAVEPAE